MSQHQPPMPAGLVSGERFANRFLVEYHAGSGGMGTVYRAQDQATGEPVALKLLHTGANDAAAYRFMREASLLAELIHPNIVRYVDHGRTADGRFYLAMEWLSGNDLEARLEQGPLSIPDTLAVLRNTASALQAAHRRNIVHRDLKPSNLFLRDGQIDRLVLLDFGIARQGFGGDALTSTGMLIGTPRYMAPEQARGQRELSPATDIFSLGALLFECLCARPAFPGHELVAVLGSILFDPSPSPRGLRPEIPDALDQLVLRMLAKDPAHRPLNAQALLLELDALPISINTISISDKTIIMNAEPLPQAQKNKSAPRTLDEQRHYSVLLAMHDHAMDDNSLTIEIEQETHLTEQKQTLRDELFTLGVRAEWLPDGSLIVFPEGGHVSDQAALAAGAALLIRSKWPSLKMSIATGRTAPHAGIHVGEAFERALQRLRENTVGPGEIALDELSALLLAGRFEIESDRNGARLSIEKSIEDRARRLLGKPTPCVGREQELSILDATLGSVIEDAEAKLVLITAAAGMGKSRLLQEFLRRARARIPEPCILYGAGDPMSAGSPYGIVGQAIARLCGIEGETSKELAIKRLIERAADSLDGDEAMRVAEFLGALCGIPFPDEDHPRLRAARSDPRLMKAQTEQAFCDFLKAESEKHPIVLILEDVHWGDALGVRLLDTALRELSECPLMVAAFGRPETKELFPKLSNGPGRQEISLKGLSKKAGERLIKAVLGKDTDPAIIERIIIQSDGNALFLEELIRAAAENKDQILPQSVLAMLEARILRLNAQERLVLRAAGMFGPVFWRNGILALIDMPGRDVDMYLDALIEEEIIEKRKTSRLPAETEFVFRHALVREAAYGLTLPDDRKELHARAAIWLAQAGEPDPGVLGEHWEQAGHFSEAARYFTDAVEKSIQSNDIEGNVTRIARAKRCNPQGETLGRLKALEVQLFIWQMRWKEAVPVGMEALALLPRSSHWHRHAKCSVAVLSGLVSKGEKLISDVTEIAADRPEDPSQIPLHIEALTSLISVCALRGERAAALVLMKQIDEIQHDLDPADLRLRGMIMSAQSEYMRSFDPDPYQQYILQQKAYDLTIDYGDLYFHLISAAFLSQTLAEIGAYEKGEAAIAATMERGKKNGPIYPMTSGRIHLASLLVQSGNRDRHDEALELCQTVLETPEAPSGFKAWAKSLMAEICLRRGELSRALDDVRESLAAESPSVWRKILSNSLQIRILLALGDTQQAVSLAKTLWSEIDFGGGAGYAEVPALVAIALALRAEGDISHANSILFRAYSAVYNRAMKIPDPDLRALYFNRCPENAEAIALSKQWGLCG